MQKEYKLLYSNVNDRIRRYIPFRRTKCKWQIAFVIDRKFGINSPFVCDFQCTGNRFVICRVYSQVDHIYTTKSIYLKWCLLYRANDISNVNHQRR
jgi:hypothetical protein